MLTAIYIQNQEIVRHDLNEPWKSCYEEALKMDSRFRGNDRVKEGVKWLKTQETAPIQAKKAEKARRSYVYFCVPSAGRWLRYSRTMESLAEAMVKLE